MLCKTYIGRRRNAAVATVVTRPGKRATLLVAGGQIFAGIRAGIIFSMLEEYDFEEDDWYDQLHGQPITTHLTG